jgi:hypothetical protein
LIYLVYVRDLYNTHIALSKEEIKLLIKSLKAGAITKLRLTSLYAETDLLSFISQDIVYNLELLDLTRNCLESHSARVFFGLTVPNLRVLKLDNTHFGINDPNIFGFISLFIERNPELEFLSFGFCSLTNASLDEDGQKRWNNCFKSSKIKHLDLSFNDLQLNLLQEGLKNSRIETLIVDNVSPGMNFEEFDEL